METKAAFNIFMHCLRMIQSTVAVFANLLTIVSIVKYRSLRNPAGILVASLAISDTLHGLVMYTLPLRTLSQKMCIGSLAAESFTLGAQLISFVLLAMERRNSLLAQLNHSTKWGTRRVVFVVIGVWAAIATINLAFALTITNAPNEGACNVRHLFPEAFINGFLVTFITATVTVVGIYGSIARIVQKTHRQVASNTARQRERHTADLRITKMMALVVGIYLLLYTPVVVSSMFMTPHPPFWKYALDQISLGIMDINFWINPAIYAWRNRQFRRAFSNLVRGRRMCCINDGDSSAVVHINAVSQHVNLQLPVSSNRTPLVPRRDFPNSLQLQVQREHIRIPTAWPDE